MSQDQKKEPSSMARVTRYSGIGIQLAGTILVFALLGRWLDDTYPSSKRWFTMGLVIFATIFSMYNVLRQVNKMNAEDDERKK